MSSLIKEFDDLVLKLDAYDLSECSILLNNRMTLDIFQYAKSKDITRERMGSWFSQIANFPVSLPALVAKLYRLKNNISKKRGDKKEALLNELFVCPAIDQSIVKETFKSTENEPYKSVSDSLAKEMFHVKVERLKVSESMKRKLKEQKQSERKTVKKLKLEHKQQTKVISKQLKHKTDKFKSLKYAEKKYRIKLNREKYKQPVINKKYKDLLQETKDNIIKKEHLKAENAELKHELEKMSVEIQKANSCIEKSVFEIKELQSVNKDLNINCHYVQTLLNDDKEIEI